jgi:hypothetical protein
MIDMLLAGLREQPTRRAAASGRVRVPRRARAHTAG